MTCMITLIGKPIELVATGTPPATENDNVATISSTMTPAEIMQWVRNDRRRLSRAVIADASLWRCPEHRRQWEITLGIEQITRRKFFLD